MKSEVMRAATIVAGLSIGTAVLSSMQQLADRPLAGSLAHPAIEYNTRPTTDLVAGLNGRLADGSARLTFDEDTGYLRSVLGALHVPIESQMLVMSKTGIQGLYTGPENPRAIYFNDAVTIGYIRGAPLLEVAVHDPQQGVVFYALEQKPQTHVAFDRRSGCVSCHQAYSTLHVPGLLARSVFIARDGLPLGQFGSYDPDDGTPFARRWGGWYVTGTHGSMRHMGNAIVTDVNNRDAAVSETTLNRTSLAGAFDSRGYLSAHSDIAALMVFQHQTRMTNLITRVGWQARIAAHGHRVEPVGGPLQDAVGELVAALLFAGEEPLTSEVRGTSGFAEMFAHQGPAAADGRSLRQLDLDRRLLRYPCSYMIYSAAFRALPDGVRAAIYSRMSAVLSGRDRIVSRAPMSDADRLAIVHILRGTVDELPPEFGLPDRHD